MPRDQAKPRVSKALDIAVALPILAGGVINGLVSLAAAAPAMAVAIFRVESVMRQARQQGDGPW
jgi:hypothetical protein